MTIEQLVEQLQELGVKSFCFRLKAGRYEAMILNQDGDAFGLADDTIEGATASLINALRTRKILGGEGWDELLNPHLN